MNISVGYVLGHFCEFLLFLYYTNTSFYPRKSYFKSNLISLLGYGVLFGIGLFRKAPISIPAFFIVNVILLMYCYNVKLRNAMFYSLIFDSLSCIGEYITMYILGLRYDLSHVQTTFTSYQMMIITIGGKIIYLIGILFLKRLTAKKPYMTATLQRY